MYGMKQITIGTHDGVFHYDEVVALALFSILYKGNIHIVRTRDTHKLKQCDLLVDIGCGRYDHHMPGFNKSRENGTPYASSGLVWEDFGKNILKELGCSKERLEECKKRVDSTLIEDLDKIDNGIVAHSPFEYISFFLPSWNAPKTNESSFMFAFEVTCQILRKALLQIIQEVEDETTLRVCLAVSGVNNIIEIPSQFIKWQPSVISHNAKSNSDVDFVIFPYPSGGYAAQCVPVSQDEPYSERIPFPEEWAGQTTKLSDISGVKTATFCHNARFFARATTRQDIIQLCKIATEKFKSN